jgi:hypothetical protein
VSNRAVSEKNEDPFLFRGRLDGASAFRFYFFSSREDLCMPL